VAALQDEQAEGNIVGLDLATGQPTDPIQAGVYDSFRVLRNCIASSSGIASNLLLCDELLKARQMVSRSPFLKTYQILISARDGRKAQAQGKERDEYTKHCWMGIWGVLW